MSREIRPSTFAEAQALRAEWKWPRTAPLSDAVEAVRHLAETHAAWLERLTATAIELGYAPAVSLYEESSGLYPTTDGRSVVTGTVPHRLLIRLLPPEEQVDQGYPYPLTQDSRAIHVTRGEPERTSWSAPRSVHRRLRGILDPVVFARP